MRARLLALCLAVIASRSSAQVVAGRTTITLPDTAAMDEAGRDVIRLERNRSAWIAAHDTGALRRVYADDFRGIAANGMRIDRAILLGVFVRDDPRATFTIDELTFKTLDAARTAAVLTGRLRTFAGSDMIAQTRYTHVYSKRDGRWQIVAAE